MGFSWRGAGGCARGWLKPVWASVSPGRPPQLIALGNKGAHAVSSRRDDADAGSPRRAGYRGGLAIESGGAGGRETASPSLLLDGTARFRTAVAATACRRWLPARGRGQALL